MKYTKKYVCLILLTVSAWQLAAQERLVTGNAESIDQPAIWLKWYNEKVFYPEGIIIYRTTQATGQRVKLTEHPVKKGDYKMTEQMLMADTSLKRYIAIANEVKPNDVKGFLSVFLILKTLENNDYAKYCGIMYEDATVVSGETYSYEVFELKNGQEQLVEKSADLKAIPHTALAAPEEFSAIAGDSEVAIHWKPEPKRYWGINVYRKTESEAAFTLANKRPLMVSEIPKEDGSRGYPDVFFNEKELQNGGTYTYRIQGIDYFARPTGYSKEIAVTPKDKTPPIAPNAVRTDVGLLDISLSWLQDNQSPDMKGYNIYRQKGRKGENLRLTKKLLPIAQRNYLDTVPEPGVYIYHVVSVDSSGNEGRSFPAVGEVLDIFPPAKPTGLLVVADTGRFILSWNPNTEKDLMGYRIYRTVGANRNSNYVLLNARPIAGTQFIDSLPKNAKNFFFYKVTALDSAFNMSEYSDPRNSRMPDVIAPREPFIIGVVQEEQALRINWLGNAESDIMGYNIYRYRPGDSTQTLKQLNSSLIQSGIHLFTDRWAENNTDYRYFLTAVDSTGNVSLPSVPYDGHLIADETCYLKVSKLKTSLKKNGTITLTWKVEHEDNYSGCILYRKTPEANAYKALTALSEATKYTDKFNSDDSVFYYQIRAYDANGCMVKSEEIPVLKK